ncbi:GGDEF domain-containing protein [Marinobacter sp. CHS3-4]|uniref:GGDEF domain-containing protein n=1 Tax=Marinobacter sp. CHS3-4 TaxID=3045174 RepID=UPI0024B57BDD|nr:GGDEF domain-containing protein [Marinobacter sp. CHS3-4]MDI9244239.1 GGDEF domain-containing protein [Marinobacter sp. CHS3-4]
MSDLSETSLKHSRRSAIDVQRRALLHWLLMLTAIFCFGFAVLNLTRGVYHLAAFELAVSVFAVVLIVILPRSRNIQPWSLIYVLLLYSMLIAALLTPGLSDKVFVWFFLIPVIAHFLHGRQLGMPLSLILLTIAWFLYYRYHFNTPGLMDMVGMTNVVACSLVLTGGVYAYETVRENAAERLHRIASTDSLTGLSNRKHLRELLDDTLAHAKYAGTGFSLLTLDLDHFKTINDQYGHDVGDQVLIAVADVMQQRLRAADTPARWGGEEFLILLPETDKPGSEKVAENIRQAVDSLEVKAGESRVQITTSIGSAQFPQDGQTIRELLEAADHRLYQAKHKGRNQVVAGAALP